MLRESSSRHLKTYRKPIKIGKREVLEEGNIVPRKFRKAIVYMMIAIMFLGTVLMGVTYF